MRNPLPFLVVTLGLLLAACGGPALLVVGETPPPPVRLLVVDGGGDPVPRAEVRVGEDLLHTDASGMVESTWRGGALAVEVRAPGFHPVRTELRDVPEGVERVTLASVVLGGRVTAEDEAPLESARVRLGSLETVTDAEGRFRLSGAVPGRLAVSRPGWEELGRPWAGGEDLVEIVLRPLRIRALYASGPVAADPETWADLVGLARQTGANGMVIDVKDSSGTVYHASTVERADEAGAVAAAYDLQALLSDLREAGLYGIARLVAFEDPVVAEAFPELAVWDGVRGAPWRAAGRAWLDPTDPDARAYHHELAVEVCRLGFQEVQFDYVRFPSDGPLGRARFDGGYDAELRVEAIAGFLDEARTVLHAEGCAVAADVFGFMTSTPDDAGIGQRFEEVAAAVDVVSPMVYPSHYTEGWFGYRRPNDHPREVVAGALDDALARMDGSTVLRPWLQAFTFGPGIGYGASQVRVQIEEAEARGLGWMLWNAGSRFNPAAIPSEEE